MKKLLKKLKYALRFVPDEIYIQLYYFAKFRRFCNLRNPKTYNEKIQWLKLHDRNPLYTLLVDKAEVKKYVAEMIGEEYIIPTLGVWDNPEDIDYERLPDQFVLKCNHDSGGVFICKDKNNFDIEYAKERLKELLAQNFYYIGREWPYKNVKRKVFAEKYLADESGTELKDYKIYVFNGIAWIIQVDFDRFSDHKRNLYTTDWEYIDASIAYPAKPDKIIEKPKQLKNMIAAAEKLSENLNHVRVDFYSIEDKVYFGELTLYPESGFGKFEPESLALNWGKWLLPGKR